MSYCYYGYESQSQFQDLTSIYFGIHAHTTKLTKTIPEIIAIYPFINKNYRPGG
jgi:hypothetical protein